MNNPEYILEDEMEVIVSKASDSLNASKVLTKSINYQFGSWDEINTILAQYSKTQEYSALKFPLFWFVQPYTIHRVNGGYFGDTSLRWFIIVDSNKDWTPKQRMELNYKPVILPIYREVINQILLSTPLFEGLIDNHLPHDVTRRPYWGEEQQQQIDDVVDCMEVNNLKLKISNNPNCFIN